MNAGSSRCISSAPVNGSALLLKANGTTATPSSYIRVTYDSGSGGRIVVTWATSTNNGTIGTFATGTWAIGDTLTAVANANGTVDVWRNATFLGRTSAAAAFTGIGRIGIRLPNTSRIDNFSGQTLP